MMIIGINKTLNSNKVGRIDKVGRSKYGEQMHAPVA